MFTQHLYLNVVVIWSFTFIKVECCIFVNNCFNMDSFSILTGTYKLAWAAHSYNTRSAINSLLFVPGNNLVRFGRKSIIHAMTLTWNHLQDRLTEYHFLGLLPKNLRILLPKFFIFANVNCSKTVDNFLVYTIRPFCKCWRW